MRPFIRSAFNYDRDAVSRETAVVPVGESKAIQSAKDECDINTIMRRFGKTGQLPVNVSRPTNYVMFSDVFDFKSAMDGIAAARESFEAMPASIRRRFDNDPAKFVNFCSDDKNLDEMREMGLAIPKKVDIITPKAEDSPLPNRSKSDVNRTDKSAKSGRAEGSVASGRSTSSRSGADVSDDGEDS